MTTTIAMITTTPATSMAGDSEERRRRETSSSPRSTKARNRPVLALGSCSNSDMGTTLARQPAANSPIQRNGVSVSALSTRRDNTITLLVLTTNDSARMRSITPSKCLTSTALMWTRASASPVIVHASTTSG